MHKFKYLELEKERLDKFLVESLKDQEISRNVVETLIGQGLVKVNGKTVVKKSWTLRENDDVVINRRDLYNVEPVLMEAEDIPVEIVYEDEYFLVVNKPSGMVVHPSLGHPNHTLVNAMIHHTKGELLKAGAEEGDIRPGIVHRIDKDTSGLVIVAKTMEAKAKLSEQIENKEIKKFYLALVRPSLEYKKGIIDAPIGRNPKDRKKMSVTEINSKESVTYFESKREEENYELVEVELITGRTHQIRVHFNYIKHPILNDPMYGPVKEKPTDYGQLLHAFRLVFIHPITNEPLDIQTGVPEEFIEYMKNNI